MDTNLHDSGSSIDDILAGNLHTRNGQLFQAEVAEEAFIGDKNVQTLDTSQDASGQDIFQTFPIFQDQCAAPDLSSCKSVCEHLNIPGNDGDLQNMSPSLSAIANGEIHSFTSDHGLTLSLSESPCHEANPSDCCSAVADPGTESTNTISSSASQEFPNICDERTVISDTPDVAKSSPDNDNDTQSDPSGSVRKTRTSTRTRKRTLTSDLQHHVMCPSCGLSLKTEELANHVHSELNKLEKQQLMKKRHLNFKKGNGSSSSGRNSIGDVQESNVEDAQSRYKSYLEIRTRRERRERAKKRKPAPGEEQTRCPVCNDVLTGTEDELAEHVDQCLQQQEEYGDQELDVEGEDDSGGFEEYTWAGQTRVRATSLLPGGLAASGFQVSRADDEVDDVDLDIDGDDSNVYGDAQYTEADLLPCSSEEASEEKERKALRNAVLRGEGSRVSRSVPCDRQRWTSNKPEDKRIQKNSGEDDASASDSNTELVESLKAKLRDQEKQLECENRPKCLICMDWYTRPLTSVQCWHVHCEECWLRTLGTKKLCPQCNAITSPADLRRIYL